MTDKDLAEVRARARDAKADGLAYFSGETARALLGHVDAAHGLLADVERDGGIEAGRRAERARVLGLLDDMEQHPECFMGTGESSHDYSGSALFTARQRVEAGGPAEALPGDEARAEVERLRAENEKYRVALRQIAGYYGGAGASWSVAPAAMTRIAREALGEARDG